MFASFIVALIVPLVICAVVQDLRLRKKVVSIERICLQLNRRAERRVLLQLRDGRRPEPLLTVSKHAQIDSVSWRGRPVLTDPECGLRLLELLNLIDIESRRERAVEEPLARDCAPSH